MIYDDFIMRYMKKILIILTLISIVTACNSKRKLFEISGKITNTTAKKVYLQYLVWGAERPIVVDSISLQKDGSFLLSTAYGNEESIYELVFDTTASVLLINDDNKVFINIDRNNFKKYVINGSKASTDLHNFLENYSAAYPALIATSMRLDTIQNEKTTDSIVTVVKLEKAQQLQKVNTIITNAFKNTTSPALRYYLIAKAFATMPVNQIQELSTVATTDQPNHTGLAFIKSIITKEVNKQKANALAVEKQKKDSILKAALIDSSKRILRDTVKLPARDSQ